MQMAAQGKVAMAQIIEISRQALHDQVVARLRTMLVEGRIAPGAKLNERELCELLRVSRTPLREAIKLLAAEGLVDLLPNRGAVAVKLSEADVLNTFEVLAAIEGQSGELAAQRVTDAELAELRALHYEMMASYARTRPVQLLPAEPADPRRHQRGDQESGAGQDLQQHQRARDLAALSHQPERGRAGRSP